jgi:shikimate kinase
MIGPPKSGKKNLGQALSERANMSQLTFDTFLTERNLHGKSDEVLVSTLILHLA